MGLPFVRFASLRTNLLFSPKTRKAAETLQCGACAVAHTRAPQGKVSAGGGKMKEETTAYGGFFVW